MKSCISIMDKKFSKLNEANKKIVEKNMRAILTFPKIDKIACLIISGFLGLAGLILFSLAFLGAPYYGDSWFLAILGLSKVFGFWSGVALFTFPVWVIVYSIYSHRKMKQIMKILECGK